MPPWSYRSNVTIFTYIGTLKNWPFFCLVCWICPSHLHIFMQSRANDFLSLSNCLITKVYLCKKRKLLVFCRHARYIFKLYHIVFRVRQRFMFVLHHAGVALSWARGRRYSPLLLCIFRNWLIFGDFFLEAVEQGHLSSWEYRLHTINKTLKECLALQLIHVIRSHLSFLSLTYMIVCCLFKSSCCHIWMIE